MNILGFEVSLSLVWFLVGVIFVALEVILPGFIVIFFTLGAWLVAIILLVFDVEVSNQILVWVVSSLVLLFSLRRYALRTFKGESVDIDKESQDSKIGKIAYVTADIKANKQGEIKVMGSFWRATCDKDVKKGASVKIIAQDDDGLTMKVEVV
jgi:inner membrane protein